MEKATRNSLKNLSPEERRARKTAQSKAYYARNKEDPEFLKKFQEANAAWYRARKDDLEFKATLSRRAKERYEKTKSDPLVREQRAVKYRRLQENRMWASIVRGALKRAVAKGLPFDPDLLEWAPTVWTGRCALSGLEFKRGVTAGPGPLSPSIDRIKPELGYTKSNCRFILHALNAMKGSGSDELMIEIVEGFYATLHPA